MWEILLGSGLSIVAGFFAIWFQSLYTRKNRKNEIIAERKVTANAQAYSCIKEIEGSLTQCSIKDTLQRIMNYEDWFFNNRLFLPGTFPEKWLSIRADLRRLVHWQEVETKTANEKTNLEIQIQNSINDAINEIYKDMNLSRIKIKDRNSKKGSWII